MNPLLFTQLPSKPQPNLFLHGCGFLLLELAILAGLGIAFHQGCL